MKIPKTSETLLLQLGRDAQSIRWSEFVSRYHPMMEHYLTRYFPTLDPDDIIQETLIALIKILPNYQYNPEETGYFHNYLTGILRHKALRILSLETRRTEQLESLATESSSTLNTSPSDQSEDEWKNAVFETALQQLLNDASIAPRTREVFRTLVLAHENPAVVADRFGLSRNAVDQIKNRLMAKLRVRVDELKSII